MLELGDKSNSVNLGGTQNFRTGFGEAGSGEVRRNGTKHYGKITSSKERKHLRRKKMCKKCAVSQDKFAEDARSK